MNLPVFDNKFKLDVTGNITVRPTVEILYIKLTPGNAASLTGKSMMIGGSTRKTVDRKLETWKENVKTVRQENSAKRNIQFFVCHFERLAQAQAQTQNTSRKKALGKSLSLNWI